MQANNVSAQRVAAPRGCARRARGTNAYFGAVCADRGVGRGTTERGSEATEDPTPAAAPAWFRLAQPELRLRLPGVSAANRPDVREKAGTWGAVARPAVYSKAAVPCFEYQLVGAHIQRGSSVAALPPGGDASSCDVQNHSWITAGGSLPEPSALSDLLLLSGGAQKHAMSCDRKFWCHAHAKSKASAGHAHTTKALAVPPALAAMGYEPANGGWQLRPGTAHCSCAHAAPKYRSTGCLERDLGLMVACQVMRLTMFSWWKTQMPGTSTERAVAACV
jgi:hypothetical protein